MRRPILVIAVSALVVGCSAPVDSVDSTASVVTTTSTTILSTTTTMPSSSTSSTSPPGPPVAWIAPSGVVLAVTGVDGDSVEVLTPCANPATLTAGTPIYDVDVVIDPGHGGPVDTGAVGHTGLAEKEINLRVSLAAQEILEEAGIPTVLTRTGDYPVPIRNRVEYARLMDAELIVSIHHNAPSAPVSDIPGVEVFVKNDSVQSQRLGGLIYESAMAVLGEFEVDWHRAPDAGVMTVLNTDGEDAYGMVRLPDIPSALVELGYIANRAEAELYSNPAYVPTVAAGVADAIETFLTSDDAGSALVEGRVFNPSRGVGRDQCVEPDLDLALYPDVVEVTVTESAGEYTFEVTVSSPYDSPERYADAWRVVGSDGVTYGVRELLHDHSAEQPFTRTLGGVVLPAGVDSVTIEARDQVYGWGGATVTVSLP